MAVANSAIALSHLLQDNAWDKMFDPMEALTDESRARTDIAATLYKMGEASSVTLSGAHNFNNRKAGREPFTHAYAMAAFANKQCGVPLESILIEDYSLDTVGQAVYTKVALALPKQWSGVIVVSSDYHLPRVRKIFDFVYGDDCAVRYEQAQTPAAVQDARREFEQKSTETFVRQFEGVARGDTEAIVRRLVDPDKGHPFYNGKKLLLHEVLLKK